MARHFMAVSYHVEPTQGGRARGSARIDLAEAAPHQTLAVQRERERIPRKGYSRVERENFEANRVSAFVEVHEER